MLLLMALLATAALSGRGQGEEEALSRKLPSANGKEDRPENLKDLVRASALPLLVLGRLEEQEEERREKEEELSWKLLSSSGEDGRGEEEEEEEDKATSTTSSTRRPKDGKKGSLLGGRYRIAADCSWPSSRRGGPSPSASSQLRRRDVVAGFSLVRANINDTDKKVVFDNVFTDLNGIIREDRYAVLLCLILLDAFRTAGMWNPRASVFVCKEPGLYFFSFNAMGRATTEWEEDDEGSAEEEESSNEGWL